MAQDHNEFTLEDILAEQRAQREVQAAEQAAKDAVKTQQISPKTPAPAARPSQNRRAAAGCAGQYPAHHPGKPRPGRPKHPA